MFLKLLQESYRNKVNRPLSFFVNWFGLTLSFAAVVVMYLYIIGEVRHDQTVYTQKMDNVYRCEIESTMGAICPAPLADFMADMPEVAQAARIAMQPGQTISTIGLSTNNKFKVTSMLADSSLLKILPFKMIAGNPDDALSDAGKAIVSRNMAIKLYGTTDVIGRGIEVDNQYPIQISGVLDEIPPSSTWYPEIIFNIKFTEKLWNADPSNMFTQWYNWNFETYIRLNPQVDPVAFEVKYSQLLKDHLSKEWGGQYNETPKLRAFQDIYFAVVSGDMSAHYSKAADADALKILGLITILILVIAIINYVNIYTARSTEVIRAMGIKSIMGGSRSRLIGFVIFDSVAITFVSAISGFLLAGMLRPLYGSIIGAEVSFVMNWDTCLVLFVGLPVLCGVLSGIFPALALTRMRPLEAIACRGGSGTKMTFVRNMLIVFQFAITIGLIAVTMYINKQMTYMNNLNLGYNRDNVYVVEGGTFMSEKFESFRSELVSNPNISNVSIMQPNPINVDFMMTVSWGETEQERETVMNMRADENALATLGIEMVEGDSISPTNKNTLGYMQMMINETFAKQLRAQNPEITFPYKQFIGVFKDFQFMPLTNEMKPLSICSSKHTSAGSAYIRIGAGSDIPATLKFVESTFKNFYPNEIFEGRFLDEQFNNMYKSDQLFRARLVTFSILAIFIGCLGLLALVGYSVQRRRKEIAVRKVYGSSVTQALVLLSVGFLKWFAISFVIATPIAWWIMNNWVEKFAHRADISWWIFAVAGVIAFIVAMVTVVTQTYSAATENPATAMKDS